MVKVIDIQPTPNPDALKFITNARLVDKGAKAFDNHRQAKGDPLAEPIFDVGPVASVFMLDRFVTVTKFTAADWDDLPAKIAETIEAKAQSLEVPGEQAAVKEDDLIGRVNQVIDQNVRPALAADGGGLEVLGVQNNVVTIRYQGACGGCPSSTSGTLNAIQNVLQRLVDEKLTVQPI
jgi:NFU1 iron-sulfur cluster scaffold homolog, mitochondrial